MKHISPSRARGHEAAPSYQPSLFTEFAPICAEEVDASERLPGGARRWIAPKEAAAILDVDPDTICRRISRSSSFGVKIRGRYFIDATKLKRPG